jgi:hypothetical protein
MSGGYDNRIAGQEARGNWTHSWTGRPYFPFDPRPEDVFIEDIAQALGKICRYNGMCRRFYSVAEHSVHVSHIVPPEHAFAGLMHDAAEAYVGDVRRPFKYKLHGYREIEFLNWQAVATRFNLPIMQPDCVTAADRAILLTEREAVMNPVPHDWNVAGEPADIEIHCWGPESATRMFAARFTELTGEAVAI